MDYAEFGDDFPRDHAHAVGVLALYYTRLEMSIFAFFQLYAPGSPEAQSYLFSSLTNAQRRGFIRAIAAANEPEEVAEAISYAMLCFDICSENRNLLMHSAPAWSQVGELVMGKIRPTEPHMMTMYNFSLADLRAAANSVDEVELYCLDLNRYLRNAQKFNALSDLPPELPRRPQQPRKLSLSRLISDPATVPPLPESERE